MKTNKLFVIPLIVIVAGAVVFLIFKTKEQALPSDALLDTPVESARVDEPEPVEPPPEMGIQETADLGLGTLYNLKLEDHNIDERIQELLAIYESGDAAEYEQFIGGLLELDMYEALDFLATLDSVVASYEDMEFPYNTVVDFLATHFAGPDRMSVLAEYVGDSSLLRTIMGDVFVNWSEEDYRGQFEWVRENQTFDNPYVFYHYLQSAVVGETGVELVQMIASLPENDLRKHQLYADSLMCLSEHSPAEFSVYMDTLEVVPPEAAQAVAGLSTWLAVEGYPDAAREWIDLIEDPELRVASYENLGGHVLAYTPEVFDEWFNAFEFESDQDRQELYEGMQVLAGTLVDFANGAMDLK